MIHRGVMSAMERLVAYLLERYDGALPLWLSPNQVMVLPVAERHEEAARALVDDLLGASVRAEMLPADATLGARVRQASERRVPCVAVIGDREVDSCSVSLRLRGGGRRSGVAVRELVGQLAAALAHRCASLD
jgi:threonyl-tRNA synthetase